MARSVQTCICSSGIRSRQLVRLPVAVHHNGISSRRHEICACCLRTNNRSNNCNRRARQTKPAICSARRWATQDEEEEVRLEANKLNRRIAGDYDDGLGRKSGRKAQQTNSITMERPQHRIGAQLTNKPVRKQWPVLAPTSRN